MTLPFAVEASRLARRGPLPWPLPAAPTTEAEAAQLGRSLWREARARAQGEPADLDDRRLYWSRLALEAALWAQAPAAARPGLLAAFEAASRGYHEDFQDPDALHLLITGFDPFLLDEAHGGPNALHRANPSGAAVLALCGRTLAVDGLRAELRGAIFPVRYADFDAGVVESFLAPRLAARPALVMTISQGRGQDFAVEQWAGRRRSASSPDNALVFTAGDASAPLEPGGLGPGPEFLRTALPSEALWAALGRPGPTEAEETLVALPPGDARPASARAPARGSVAVCGSGGGYLSNEIFYRASRLRHAAGLAVPLGHLHTPFLAPPVAGETDPRFEAARAKIVADIAHLLRAVVPVLARRPDRRPRRSG